MRLWRFIVLTCCLELWSVMYKMFLYHAVLQTVVYLLVGNRILGVDWWLLRKDGAQCRSCRLTFTRSVSISTAFALETCSLIFSCFFSPLFCPHLQLTFWYHLSTHSTLVVLIHHALPNILESLLRTTFVQTISHSCRNCELFTSLLSFHQPIYLLYTKSSSSNPLLLCFLDMGYELLINREIRIRYILHTFWCSSTNEEVNK